MHCVCAVDNWEELVKYLADGAQEGSRDVHRDGARVSYAMTNRLADLEEFISGPNHAAITQVLRLPAGI